MLVVFLILWRTIVSWLGEHKKGGRRIATAAAKCYKYVQIGTAKIALFLMCGLGRDEVFLLSGCESWICPTTQIFARAWKKGGGLGCLGVGGYLKNAPPSSCVNFARFFIRSGKPALVKTSFDARVLGGG